MGDGSVFAFGPAQRSEVVEEEQELAEPMPPGIQDRSVNNKRSMPASLVAVIVVCSVVFAILLVVVVVFLLVRRARSSSNASTKEALLTQQE